MSNISGRSGSFTVPGGLIELGYGQMTSNITINNATAGVGTEVIAPLTVVCDGNPILVEFFSPEARPSQNANDELNISLFEDSSEKIRSWGRNYNAAGGYNNKPTYLSVRLTPSAGTHTYGVKAYVSNASNAGSVGGGTGTSTTSAPCFLRVSKIVEQGTSLKPFWTPPIVTELPTNATLGDMVTLASANGNHRPAQYDGTDWQIMGVGSKPPSAQLWASSWNMASEGVGQQVTGFSAQWDNDSMTNTSDRITINTPGLYHANGAILTPTGTNTDYRCGLRITQFNSSNVQVLDVSHAGSYINIGWGKDRTVAGTFKCSEGDYLILRVDVDSSTGNTNMPFTAGRLTASFIGQA
jgi:hypothetical protein